MIEITPSSNIDLLTALLADADEDEARVREAVAGNTSYLITLNGAAIGALTMYWDSPESEILYIAVDDAHRGHGAGRIALVWVIDEARRRGIHTLTVGTASSSFGALAFYQKCGFRVTAVRRDYFAYIQPPAYENGIQIRDMLVLQMDTH